MPGSPAEVYCRENAFEYCYPEGGAGSAAEDEPLPSRTVEAAETQPAAQAQETGVVTVWEEDVTIHEEKPEE